MGGANYEDDSNSTGGGGILLKDREDNFSIYEVVKNKNIAVRVDYSYKVPKFAELEKDPEIWIYNLRIGKFGIYPDQVKVSSIDEFCLHDKEMKNILSSLSNGGNKYV